MIFSENAVLGMNRRNAAYLLPYNKRKDYPLVDDKLSTKRILEANGLPSPVLYLEMQCSFQMHALNELSTLNQFVIKPARGSGGRGILPIVGRCESGWLTSSGKLHSKEDIEYHISNILAGLYSLGGVPDKAFAEYYIQSHPSLGDLCFKGVPDIRVILYRGIPIMAMLRLPTKQSKGCANLHQGAVGVGFDMNTEKTIGGVHRSKFVDLHPDTAVVLAGREIPFWKPILEISAEIYDHFRMGYIGVDFVVDSLMGPLILELNARPGLNIQAANRKGLLPLLKKVDQHLPPRHENAISPKERLDLTAKIHEFLPPQLH